MAAVLMDGKNHPTNNNLLFQRLASSVKLYTVATGNKN
jgi:hypothetical protein